MGDQPDGEVMLDMGAFNELCGDPLAMRGFAIFYLPFALTGIYIHS